MRDIKFRGKRVDNGEWVYGYFYNDNMIGCNIFQTKPHLAAILVDPSTVGQYTGRFDKNNKEVYEGDIVAFEVWHGGVEHIIAEAEAEKQGKKINWIRPHVILFNKYGSFCMKPVEFIDDETWYGYQIPDADRIEIIGNIWDNPELLKEGNV